MVANHPCDVFSPTQPNANGYVVLYLHGVHLKRLVDKPAFTTLFEKHGLVVVAPMTGRSWWTDRICREFDPRISAERHVLDHVMPFIQARFGASPPRIGLLGTSMGGQGALRLAYRYPTLFPTVTAISPAIDFHLRMMNPVDDDPLLEMYRDPEAARQDTAILHVHPLNWPRHQFFCCDPDDTRWFDSSDRLRMKLASIGIPFQCDLETRAGGHGFAYYNAMAETAIDFLVNALNSERLKVL